MQRRESPNINRLIDILKTHQIQTVLMKIKKKKISRKLTLRMAYVSGEIDIFRGPNTAQNEQWLLLLDGKNIALRFDSF